MLRSSKPDRSLYLFENYILNNRAQCPFVCSPPPTQVIQVCLIRHYQRGRADLISQGTNLGIVFTFN